MRNRGFTIIELLVGIVLFAIVGAAFTKLLTVQGRFFDRQGMGNAARNVSRASLNRVVSDFRMIEATGGVIAQASDAGHRVVLVVATRGELGTAGPGVLPAGPELAAQRTVETERAAEILGVSRVEFLGYHDSGMAGTPTNDAPGSFWSANVEEAAARLAAILDEEHADVLTTYDERGVYDHPDHIQVHRVGIRAAELAGTPRVYESTIDSSYLRDLMDHAAELIPGGIPPDLPDAPSLDLGVDPVEDRRHVHVGDTAELHHRCTSL